MIRTRRFRPSRPLPRAISWDPSPQERFELTKLAFRSFQEAEVSDMELKRGGESYTSDTVAELAARYPGAELWLVIGTGTISGLS